MASKQDKLTLKENGHVVMEALREIDQMPTLLNLTRYIANTYKTSEEKVKEPLRKVLESGMDLGIITRQKGKYYLYGEESDDDGEVVDRGRRRRKGRSRSRKRGSRSRSRRRRKSR